MRQRPTPKYAWLNGKIIPWEDCKIHTRAPGAAWGVNVFEGVRAYWSPNHKQLRVFRLDDHLHRLAQSARSLRISPSHDGAELRDACLELLDANGVREDAHVVIGCYLDTSDGFDALGLSAKAGAHITAMPVPRRRAFEEGIAVGFTSWRRVGEDVMPPRIKTGANYHNGRLAHQDAVRNGYDTALMLNSRGTIAEAPDAAIVMVRGGRLVTPPVISGVLESITVKTVAEIAEEALDIKTDCREIDRAELDVADEVFLCGTLAEILPVTSIDRLPVGKATPGPVTSQLQTLYDDTVRGHTSVGRWTTPVSTGRKDQHTGVADDDAR
jgi:branched-chain amino acid aminotransferase